MQKSQNLKNRPYTDDPKKNPEARFIPEIGTKDLREKEPDDLLIERPCLDITHNSEGIEYVQIINGMSAGNMTRALAGERVGTIIYKQEPTWASLGTI